MSSLSKLESTHESRRLWSCKSLCVSTLRCCRRCVRCPAYCPFHLHSAVRALLSRPLCRTTHCPLCCALHVASTVSARVHWLPYPNRYAPSAAAVSPAAALLLSSWCVVQQLLSSDL